MQCVRVPIVHIFSPTYKARFFRLFMRPGSTAVVYCRFVDTTESSNEVRIWLQAVPGMHLK